MLKSRLLALLLASAFSIPCFVGSAGAEALQLVNGWTQASSESGRPEVFLADGIVSFKGAIANGTTGVAFTLPVAMRPPSDVYVAIDLCNAAPGRLIIQASGVVSVQSSTVFADAQCFSGLDGAMFAPSATGFTALTLLNSWTGAPFGTSIPAAALINGIVYLKGAVQGGSTSLLFTLPIPLRPATDVYMPVNLVGGLKGRLLIHSTGAVEVFAASGTFSEAQLFTSLDGVTFAPSASGFTNLTLANGWINYPIGTSIAAASLIGGSVRLKGAISSGANTVAFTLPLTMRPATTVQVAVDLCNAAPGRLVISTNGDVLIFARNAFADAQCFTSLDGAAFVVSPNEFTGPSPLNGWIDFPGAQPAGVALYDGVVYFRGAVYGGATDVLFTLPGLMRPATDTYVAIDLCNAVPGRLIIHPSGVVNVQASTSLADAQCFTSLEGASFAPGASGFTDLTPFLLNSWTGAPFGTSAPAAARINGIVHLKGAVANGTNNGLFTLPIGMRPATDVYLLVGLCFGVKGRLLIQPSGVVSVSPLSALTSQCFTSLDGAKFAPAPAGFPNLSLANGWISSPFSTSRAAASIQRNIVFLRGAISSGTSNLITTLSPILRPAGTVYVPIDLCSGTKGRLLIQSNGAVSVADQGGGFSNASCFTSLDGATYAVPEPFGLSALVSGLLLLVGIARSKARCRRRGAA